MKVIKLKIFINTFLISENSAMKFYLIFMLSLALLLAACIAPPTGNPGFRVRSDFSAPLNSDQGWEGDLNEDVTDIADQPFRIRFEVESLAEPARDQRFRLQYRRNNGDWIDVEAHDFPHPLREISLDFTPYNAGARPDDWTVVKGDSTKLIIATDSQENILQAQADQGPLVALFAPPWEATEMVAQFRLAPNNPK